MGRWKVFKACEKLIPLPLVRRWYELSMDVPFLCTGLYNVIPKRRSRHPQNIRYKVGRNLLQRGAKYSTR